MATKSKEPTIPKPRKAIPCVASSDADEVGRNYAAAITGPEVSAYRVIAACETPELSDQLDVPGMLLMLKGQADAINRGDMVNAEAMLTCQATALQTLFARLTERAMTQTHMPNLEAFMRLALRAQSQSRATLETLAAIKNPPVIYAKQVNQTTGPQQVNNGNAAPSRKREIKGEQSKLLEAEHEQWMDTRATGAASGVDTTMEAVGAIERAEVRGGQGSSGRKCLQGRGA